MVRQEMALLLTLEPRLERERLRGERSIGHPSICHGVEQATQARKAGSVSGTRAPRPRQATIGLPSITRHGVVALSRLLIATAWIAPWSLTAHWK